MDPDAIKRALAESGLRSTPQRYAVMAFLMEQAGHPTAPEIFEAVNRLDPRSSRSTTYNNLRDLVQAGLVRQVAEGLGSESAGRIGAGHREVGRDPERFQWLANRREESVPRRFDRSGRL